MAEESLNAEIAQVKLSDLFLRREWVPAQQSPFILTGMMAGIFSRAGQDSRIQTSCLRGVVHKGMCYNYLDDRADKLTKSA